MRVITILMALLLCMNLASAVVITQVSTQTPPDGRNNFYTQDFVVVIGTDLGPAEYVNVTFDGQLISTTSQSDTNYTATITTSGKEGNYGIQVDVAYLNGNTTETASLAGPSVNIDSLAPDIVFSGTNLNTTISESDKFVVLSVEMDDGFPDYATAIVDTTETNVSINTGTGTLTMTPLQLGCQNNSTCDIVVEVYDEAGNMDTSNVGDIQLIVASQNQSTPTNDKVDITIRSPINDSLESDSEVQFSINVNVDPNDIPASSTVFCKYELIDDETSVTAKFGNYFTYDFEESGSNYDLADKITEVQDGNYRLRITCYDDEATEYIKKIGFVVLDTTSPNVDIIIDALDDGANITLNSSELFMLTDFEYKIFGTANSTDVSIQDTFNTKFSFVIDGLIPNNAYVIQIRGTDRAGDATGRTQNEFVKSESFETVEGSKPEEKQLEDVTVQGTKKNLTTVLEGEKYSHGIDWLRQNVEMKILVTNFDMILREVLVTAREDIRNIKFESIVSDNGPDSIKERPSASAVYKYLEIKAENADDDKIKTTKLRFEVSQIWLNDEGILKENIALFRWVDDEWKQLPTSIIKEGALNIEYEALSPGFSFFAVAEKRDPLLPKEEEPEEKPEEVEETTEEPEEKPEENEGGLSWFKWILGILVIAILGVLGYYAATTVKFTPKKVNADDFDHRKAKMHMKRLEKFVEESLARGHDKEKLRSKLIESGWDAKLVEFVMRRKG